MVRPSGDELNSCRASRDRSDVAFGGPLSSGAAADSPGHQLQFASTAKRLRSASPISPISTIQPVSPISIGCAGGQHAVAGQNEIPGKGGGGFGEKKTGGTGTGVLTHYPRVRGPAYHEEKIRGGEIVKCWRAGETVRDHVRTRASCALWGPESQRAGGLRSARVGSTRARAQRHGLLVLAARR